MIAAAGNDGAEGAFFISSPGTGAEAVAVASIDNDYNLQQAVQAENGAEYRKCVVLFFFIKAQEN